MNAITGLPAKTQVYKIDDYADLDHSDGCPLLGVIVVACYRTLSFNNRL